MDELREKCPWDQKQTMESLRHLTLEETFELSESILEGDSVKIKKELGDVLLHIIFYAKIASEAGQFDITDVINSLCDKLIHRHPHIYGEVKVNGAEEVKKNWEKLKLKEGNHSALDGVPKGLPALIKAIRIQEKARGVGFDWENESQVWEKVLEELKEFREESDAKPVQHEKMQEEFGDLIFALVNYSRFVNINPEEALERTNLKFISRFRYMEEKLKEAGKQPENMTLKELDVFWEQAKLQLGKAKNPQG